MSTTRPLFDIGADLLALAALLTETGGDVTDADAEAAITAWFADLGRERDTKIDHYCALIREYEHRKAGRLEEAHRLAALASVDDHTAQRLRARLFQFFQLQGLARLTTERFELGIVRNGGLTPLEHLTPATELPPRFQKVFVDYDNAAIRQALDAGEILPWVSLGTRGERLSIR
jgi:hypothetical protein